MDRILEPIILDDDGFTLDLSHCGILRKQVEEMFPAVSHAVGSIGSDQGMPAHVRERAVYQSSPIYEDIQTFFERLRRGKFSGATGRPFAYVIFAGCGGSVLGAQFLQQAFRGTHWNERDKFERDNYPRIYFLDNSDPSCMQDILDVVDLDRTMVVFVSKSGQTPETWANLQVLQAIYDHENIDFSNHACAVTVEGSPLDSHAHQHNWSRIWVMAPEVPDPTLISHCPGHALAAASGINFEEFLNGMHLMDELCLNTDAEKNPAALLAATWYLLGAGHGERHQIIMPFSSRLSLLGRFLQHLIMSSIGREKDRDSNIVEQGMTACR